MTDERKIISVADARDTIREAAGRNVPCSFMIMVDPEMRPRKLIALLFVACEAAGERPESRGEAGHDCRGRVLLDDFSAIAAMMPAGMRYLVRRPDDPPYVLGYWTNADPGPTVH